MAEHIAQHFCDQVFTDAIGNPIAYALAAAYAIPVLKMGHAGRLSLRTLTTTAEISALSMALEHIRMTQ